MAGHSDGGGIGDGYKRRTRSQFRPCALNLTPFKSANPAELEVNMDFSMSHSPSSHHQWPGYSPPIRNGQTIGEINKEMDDLRKENFTLKLRLYMLEKKLPKDLDHDSRENFKVNVQLGIETETLRSELKIRNKMLQEALNAAKHFETKLQDSKEQVFHLEQKISSLIQETQTPTTITSHSESDLEAYKKAFDIEASLIEKSMSNPESLTEMKINFEKEIERLENVLFTKEQEIEDANKKLSEIQNENHILKEKTKKKSIAIQGLVQKLKDHPDHRSKEMWSTLLSAIEAAKNRDVETVISSVKEIKTSLCELLSMPYCGVFKEITPQEDYEREIQQNKELNKSLEEAQLAEQFARRQVYEKNIKSEKRIKELEKVLAEKESADHNHFAELQSMSKEFVLKDEHINQLQDALDKKDSEFDLLQKSHEKLVNEFHATKSQMSVKESEQTEKKQSKSNISRISLIIEDNKKLLLDVGDKEDEIGRLATQCGKLEEDILNLRTKHYHAVARVKELEKTNQDKDQLKIPTLKTSSTTQTERVIVEESKESSDVLRSESLTDFGKSDSIVDLKEDVFVLILKIEDKDKEIQILKKQLQDAMMSKKDSGDQINLLQHHLEKLAEFMGRLIQDRSRNISLDSSYETSDLLNEASQYLQQSLLLSHTLSQNLTICEDSKIFHPEESFALLPGITNDGAIRSCLSSLVNQTEASVLKDGVIGMHSEKEDFEGRSLHIVSHQDVSRTGKRRRWSYMVQHKPATQSRAIDVDQIVLHSSSDSEDTLQLPNRKEFPEQIQNRSLPLDPNIDASLCFVETAVIGDGIKNNIHPYANSEDHLVHKPRLCWNISDKDVNLFYANLQEQNEVFNVEVQPFNDTEKQIMPWPGPCISSDSDIWSEPDRTVSMQRLGIDMKSSFTSPSRKHQATKDKRISEDFSTESSVSVHGLSKKHSRRKQRCGSATKNSESELKPYEYNNEVERRLSYVENQQSILTALNEKFENIGSQISSSLGEFKRLSLGESDGLENISHEINVLKSALSLAVGELKAFKGTVKEDIRAAHDSNTIKEIKQTVEKIVRTINDGDQPKDIVANQTRDVAQKALSELDSIKKQLEDVNFVLFENDNDKEMICEQALIQTDMPTGNFANNTHLKHVIEKERAQNYQLQKNINTLYDENRSLKETLENLKQDLVSEQERLNALNKERNELRRKSKEITSESGDFKQRLQLEEERMKVLLIQKSELKQKLYQETTENQNLKEVNAQLEYQKLCLQEEKMKCKAEFLSVEALCEELKNDLKVTKEKLNHLLSKCSQYEKDIINVSNEKEELLLKKQALKDINKSQAAKISELNKQYSDTKLQLSEKDQLVHENQQLEDTVKSQIAKMNELGKQYSNAKLQLMRKDQLLIENQQLEDMVKTHESKITELSKQCSDAKVRNDQYLLQIQQLEDTVKSQASKINELSKQNSDAKIRLNEKDQLLLEKQQLEVTIKAQTAKITELSRQYADAKLQLNDKDQIFEVKPQLESTINSQTSKILELSKKYSSAKQELKEKDKQKDLLLLEIQQLEDTVKSQTTEINELCKQCSDANMQLSKKDQLLLEKQQLEVTIKSQTAKIDELCKQYSDAKLQLSEKDQLHQEKQQLEATVKSQTDKIADLDRKYSGAKLKLTEKDNLVLGKQQLEDTVASQTATITEPCKQYSDVNIQYSKKDQPLPEKQQQEVMIKSQTSKQAKLSRKYSDAKQELNEKDKLLLEMQQLEDTVKSQATQIDMLCKQCSDANIQLSKQDQQLRLEVQQLKVTLKLQTAEMAELCKQYDAKLQLNDKDQGFQEKQELEATIKSQTSEIIELNKKYLDAKRELKEKETLVLEKQQLEDTVASQTAKITDLNRKYSVAKLELTKKDKLILENQQLEDTVTSQTAKITELCKRYSDAKLQLNEKDQLLQEKQQLEATVKSQTAKITDLDRKYSGAKLELTKRDKLILEKQQLEDTVTSQTAEITELCKRYSDAMLQLNEKEQLLEEKQQLEATVKSQTTKITDLDRKYFGAKLELDEKDKLILEKQQLEETVASQIAKITELTKQYSETKLQVKNLQAKGDSIKTVYGQIVLENNKLSERIIDFEQQLNDKNLSLDRITDQGEMLKHQILSMQDEAAQKGSLIKKLEEQKENLQNERDVVKSCLVEKEEKLKKLEKNEEEANYKLIAMQQSNLALQQQLKKVKEVKDNLKKSESDISVELKEERKKSASLESQVSELLQKLLAKDVFSDKFNDKSEELSTAISLKDSVVQPLKSNSEASQPNICDTKDLMEQAFKSMQQNKFQQEIDTLKNQTAELQQQMLNKDATIQNLYKERAELRIDVSKKEDCIKMLESNLNISKTELNIQQSTISELQKQKKILEIEKDSIEKEKLNIQHELVQVKQKLVNNENLKSTEENNFLSNQLLVTKELLKQKDVSCKELENEVQILHSKILKLQRLADKSVSSSYGQSVTPSISQQQNFIVSDSLNDIAVQKDDFDLTNHFENENHSLKVQISALLKEKDGVNNRIAELEEQLKQKKITLKKATDELRQSQTLLVQQQEAMESMKMEISMYKNKLKIPNDKYNLEVARSGSTDSESDKRKSYISDPPLTKEYSSTSTNASLPGKSLNFSAPDKVLPQCETSPGIDAENFTYPELFEGTGSNNEISPEELKNHSNRLQLSGKLGEDKLGLQSETSNYLETKCLQQIESFSKQDKVYQDILKTSSKSSFSERDGVQSVGLETADEPNLELKSNEVEMKLKVNNLDKFVLPQSVASLQHENGGMSETSSLESVSESVSSFIEHFVKDPTGDADVLKKLNVCKWNLQKSILNLQKEIFKSSPIHLEKHINFIKHIINIHSQEVFTSVAKPQSEPSLYSSANTNAYVKCVEKTEIADKNRLLHLKIDIECLQNIKLLLKYFVIPLAQQTDLSELEESDPTYKSEVINTSPSKKVSTHGSRESLLETHHKTKKIIHKNEETKLLQRNLRSCEDSDSQRSEKIEDKTLHESESVELLRSRSRSKELETSLSQAIYMEKSVREKKLQKKIVDLIKRLGSLESVNRVLKLELKTYEKITKGQALTEGALVGKDAMSLSLVLNLLCEMRNLRDEMDIINQDNSLLKEKIQNSRIKSLTIPKKDDISDQESALSADDTVTLSRSASLSQISIDSLSMKNLDVRKNSLDLEPTKENDVFNPISQRSESTNFQESVFQRSNYSSPDLGIESDPNHDASVPEHMRREDFFYHNRRDSRQIASDLPFKIDSGFIHSFTKPIHVTGRGISWVYSPEPTRSVSKSDTLHAIGLLREYELLKKEVEESVVGIKGISSRARDCLKHLAKHTTPKKSLEYSTLKAILDSCNNVEVCLLQAQQIVNNFWFSTFPNVPGSGDWNSLIQQNQELRDQLLKLTVQMKEQETHFKDAVERLKYAQMKKDDMERDIAKQLVKTKKVLRKAKANLQGISKDKVTGARSNL